MASVGNINISFSGLRGNWGSASYAGGSDPGSNNISLSEFRGATFTDSTLVPSSNDISIEDDFKGKTFGHFNTIEIKYHRFGATFNESWSGAGMTIEDGTFIAYFWNTDNNTLTKLGRIVNQTHTSSSQSYTTVTYTINAPADSTGYLLLLLYGWNNFTADMALGLMTQKYSNGNTHDILYQESTVSNTAMQGLDWEDTARISLAVSSIVSNNITDLEDELAQRVSGLNSYTAPSWNNLAVGTSTSGGWQQDIGGTGSSNTGPDRSSAGHTNSYYIYCETSSASGTTNLYHASIRCPITISLPGYTLTILVTTDNFAGEESNSSKTITIGSDTKTFAQAGDVTDQALTFSGLSGTTHQLTFGFNQGNYGIEVDSGVFVGAVNGVNNFGSGTTGDVSLSSEANGGFSILIES